MIGRRALLGLATLVLGCDRPRPRGSAATSAAGPAPSDAPASTSGLFARYQELDFEPGAFDEAERALLLVQKAPLLIALHGRGEAGRGLSVGARGWRDDYHLDTAYRRLFRPPLTSEDFLGFVAADRLARLNQALAHQPFRGLAVACPYTPALADRSLDGARAFGAFVTRELVPRAQSLVGTGAVGIDGVSMGGRLALLVGLSHPELFKAVGAMQPAIRPAEAPWLAELAQRAVARGVRLRLVSSRDDPFLPAVEALCGRLAADKVEHQLLVTPGPHDYVWNRGPGSLEMLAWHDRALRGEPPP